MKVRFSLHSRNGLFFTFLIPNVFLFLANVLLLKATEQVHMTSLFPSNTFSFFVLNSPKLEQQRKKNETLIRLFQLSYKISLTLENCSNARFNTLHCFSSSFPLFCSLPENAYTFKRVEKGKKDTDDIYLIALNTKEGKVMIEQSRASKTQNQKLV